MACFCRTLLITSVLVGCGPNVPVDDGSDAESGTSSSTGDPSESGDVTTTDTVTSGVDTGPICEAFFDEPGEVENVLVDIRNESDEPVLLPMPCGIDYLTIESDEGWRWPGDWCSNSCEDQFENGCIICDGCASAAYIRIEPGGHYTLEWAGFVFERLSPPEACFALGPCGETCERLRFPGTEVTLRATAIATSVADCEAAEGDPAVCTCMPNEDGWCDFYGSNPAPTALMATALFQPSPGSPIEIVFE